MQEAHSLLGIAEDAYARSAESDPTRPLLRLLIIRLLKGSPAHDVLDASVAQALHRLRGQAYETLAHQYGWPLDPEESASRPEAQVAG